MKKRLALLLALIAATAYADEIRSGGARVLENPDVDGNLVLRINDGGSKKDALTLEGATGSTAIGVAGDTTTQHYVHGEALNLYANGRLRLRDGANSNWTDVWTSTASGSAELSIAPGGGSAKVKIAESGAIDLGPSGFQGTHTATGNFSIAADLFSVSNLGLAGSGTIQVVTTTNSVTAELKADASGATGTSPAKLTLRANPNAQNQIDSSAGRPMQFLQDGTLVGGYTDDGWVVGDSSLDMDNYVRTNSTTKAALQIRNYDTSTSSDGVEALTVVKGSTTNTSSQRFIAFYINAASTGSGMIAANGASAAGFATLSDERLKENVEYLPPQLDRIAKLRPVEFDYKDGSGHQIGFIAQEMQTVYPDAVSTDDDGMLAITGWSKTEARLVKAIQELKAQNDTLKARLDAAGL